MSYPASVLVVDSVTGVEVVLPVAGPGVRAFAFVIDWHIRAILAITWYVLGMMLYNQDIGNITPPIETDGILFAFIWLPSGAIYFLYHPVLEIAMRGRTPGKRMAGVRLVTRIGGMPTFGAHMLRNVFRLVDQFPVFYGLGLVMTMVTRNHVRLGDLAAGTILVYDRVETVFLEHVRNSRLDASTAEVVNELLRRWETLDMHARSDLARKVLRAAPEADDGTLRMQLQRLAEGTGA